MKRILLLILSLLSLLTFLLPSLSSCGCEAEVEPLDSGKLVYKTVGERELSLELLRPTDNMQRKSPAVIVLHGGGWVSGAPEDFTRDFAPLCELLRENGIAVIPVEYSLVCEGSSWRDALDDCEDALNYLIENAKSLGLDETRLGIVGYSAGAQLALMTAIETRDKLRLCTSMSAPTLIADSEQSLYYSDALNYYVERVFDKEDMISMYQASPMIRVNRNCKSDFLLVCGTDDEVVGAFHAQSFYNEVRSFAINVELLEYKGLTHSYTSYPEFDSLCGDIAERIIEELE